MSIIEIEFITFAYDIPNSTFSIIYALPWHS